MRRARLTQDVIALERSLTETAAGDTINQLHESLDCPDCYDTLIKFYDWDNIKYKCENCELLIADPAILSMYVNSGVRN